MVLARLRHFADLRNRNSIITTLPLKLERSICLPEGSWMANSGDLRGKGAADMPSDTELSTKARMMDVSFFIAVILTDKNLVPGLPAVQFRRFWQSWQFWHFN